jgi:hypothetical protein
MYHWKTKEYRHLMYTKRDYRSKLLGSAKSRAKASGMEFTIGKEDIVLSERCALLDVEIDYSTDKGQGGSPHSPSLDRIDNSKGYVPGNVWVISRQANTMKSSASYEELLLFAKNISIHFGETLSHIP